MFIYTVYDCNTGSLAAPKICPLPWSQRGNLGLLFLANTADSTNRNLLLVMFLPNKPAVAMMQPLDQPELSDEQLHVIESHARQFLSSVNHSGAKNAH